MTSVNKWVMAVVIFVQPFLGSAQLSPVTPNHIEVIGTAEIELSADEHYYSVTLKEYFKDEKNQKDKIDINTLEKQLIKAIAGAGLPTNAMTVTAMGGGQTTWEKKKQSPTFLETRQYEIKVENVDKLDGILSKVDSKGVLYARISRVDLSNKEEVKRELKIKAIQEAKNKATLMLAAIGEKIGQPITIQEYEDSAPYMPVYARAASMAKMEDASIESEGSGLEFKKIKYSTRVRALFAIKP